MNIQFNKKSGLIARQEQGDKSFIAVNLKKNSSKVITFRELFRQNLKINEL